MHYFLHFNWLFPFSLRFDPYHCWKWPNYFLIICDIISLPQKFLKICDSQHEQSETNKKKISYILILCKLLKCNIHQILRAGYSPLSKTFYEFHLSLTIPRIIYFPDWINCIYIKNKQLCMRILEMQRKKP